MLCLYGAGGHAKVVLEIAEELNIPIEGVIDENENILFLLGYKVCRNYDAINPKLTLILSIGSNSIRKKLAERFHKKTFISLLHPKGFISKRAEIDVGTVVMAGVSINSSVKIGKHVIINTNSSIDHDCIIGDYVHVAPNASLAGGISVGEGTFIGIGACVKQDIKIGKWAIIGAGSVVVADVSDYSTVLGNPARKIKK